MCLVCACGSSDEVEYVFRVPSESIYVKAYPDAARCGRTVRPSGPQRPQTQQYAQIG